MIAIYLALLMSIGWLTSRLLLSPLAKIPGPKLAAFTSWVLKYHEFRGKRRLFVHDLHRRYGSTVRIAPNEVSFASYPAAKEIYASGGAGYDKTEFYSVFGRFGVRNMFSTLVKQDVFLPSGSPRVRRRGLAEAYSNSHVMQPAVIHEIEERARELIAKCSDASVDIYVELHCYALDCISQHLFHPFGTHSLTTEQDFEKMKELSYSESLTGRLLGYYSPFLLRLMNSGSDRVKAGSTVDLYLHDSVGQETAPWTVLKKLKQSKESLGATELASECSDHLSAGIDTTGDALCFLMYQLSKPECEDIQRKLHKELSESKELAFDKLPYLDAVVKEGLRCFAPIPMSLPRYVPAGGRLIDGHIVPGQTIVSCQAWTLHRIESVFPGADKFDPGRWLEPGLEQNHLFFAFSIGGRGCIGRNLAIAEMKILLRAVYSKLRSHVAPDMTASMELADQIISSRPRDMMCKLTFNSV